MATPDKWENIDYRSLSRTTLIEIINLYSTLYRQLDGFWYLSVKEKINDEQALACDEWVWDKMCVREIRGASRILKTDSDDVASLLRALLVTPFFNQWKCEVDVRDRNYAVLTITRCPILEALEREGQGREKSVCQKIDRIIFARYAECFNPKIETTALKLPPRSSNEETCCQWEFRIPRSEPGLSQK